MRNLIILLSAGLFFCSCSKKEQHSQVEKPIQATASVQQVVQDTQSVTQAGQAVPAASTSAVQAASDVQQTSIPVSGAPVGVQTATGVILSAPDTAAPAQSTAPATQQAVQTSSGTQTPAATAEPADYTAETAEIDTNDAKPCADMPDYLSTCTTFKCAKAADFLGQTTNNVYTVKEMKDHKCLYIEAVFSEFNGKRIKNVNLICTFDEEQRDEAAEYWRNSSTADGNKAKNPFRKYVANNICIKPCKKGQTVIKQYVLENGHWAEKTVPCPKIKL